MSQGSSQNSDLNADELDILEESAKPESTKNVTTWGVNVFNTWCLKRRKQIDLLTVSSDVLASTLRSFYAEVKTKKGTPMTPSSLVGLLASLHRYITPAPIGRSINIINDRIFKRVNLDRKLTNNLRGSTCVIISGDVDARDGDL